MTQPTPAHILGTHVLDRPRLRTDRPARGVLPYAQRGHEGAPSGPVRLVSRPEAAAPAVGSVGMHRADQVRLIARAFAPE